MTLVLVNCNVDFEVADVVWRNYFVVSVWTGLLRTVKPISRGFVPMYVCTIFGVVLVKIVATLR